MAKTVTLTRILVDKVTINVAARLVTVEFRMVDDNGEITLKREATFFAEPPAGYESRKEWFLLPASYVTGLTNLVADATAAITARFLV